MWSDNASNVDLLGYEDLVTEIVDLTTDPTLQPLTIGAFADWGAGKSTLLQLCSKELQDHGAIVVEFSPWLVEGYDDVKSCLLGAVLDTIAASDEVGKVEKLGNLVKSLKGRINWMRLAKLGASAVVPIAGVALDTLETVLDGQADKASLASSSAVSAGFHREFETLVGGLGNDQTVVVLIDDLDRCLPNQIIDTLEALRLFLAAPGTAFVIAADERLVRDAVRHRYSSAAAVEVDLPRDYLEKLVQVPVRIPPLTVPDAESYCNLLVAQLHLEADDFNLVLSRATEIRSTGDLQVSCNVGIARDALGEHPLPSAAEEDFGLIAKVIQPLASGLNGNPRQIKRFLNSLNIRRRTAARRDIGIDDVTLAKLGVLEYVRDAQFRELHQWQMNGGGIPEEITELETLSSDPEIATTSAATGAWAADPWIREWLDSEPPLTGVDLSPYFFLSRDRLGSASAQTNQLSPGLQVLTSRLGDEQSATREAAVDSAVELDATSLLLIVQACSARLPGLPDKQPIMRSMVEIAERHTAMAPQVIAAFSTLAFPEVPVDVPLVMAGRLGAVDVRESTIRLLSSWETQEASPQLSKMALAARRKLLESNGNL